MKEDCYKKQPYCLWNGRDDSAEEPQYSTPDCQESSEGNKYSCLFFPKYCGNTSCPEWKPKPEICVSIGELTPEELITLKEKTRNIEKLPAGGIRELADVEFTDEFFLWPKDKIYELPKNDGDEYIGAIDEYEKFMKRFGETVRNSSSPTWCENHKVLDRCVEIADRIRKLRKTLPAVSKKKGGRRKHKRTEWIEYQFRQGLTPSAILDHWGGMSDDERKAIDPINYQPLVSIQLKNATKTKEARKKAIDLINKKRPK